ncbi:uncharacterized protein LOC130818140 [Amaranthus tricolor]|uniref:uncharacterized protein LOC130818140 n=1 Tax=Amaranthus tricolor TaxID=29722 RepID=UPI0025865F60|nr:uncharacterized protein LOC130818140 [Amaranthus tricolor]
MASKLVMLAVFVLNAIAFGLAVAAEQRRSHAQVISDPNADYKYCKYDSDIATAYGLGAFFCLLASQAIVMVASRCFCCGPTLSPGGSRACAVMLFIVCWLTFFIAEICLLAGSARNAYHTKYKRFYEEAAPSCETLRKGVFAAGAAFTFFTAIITEFYYVCYSRAKDCVRS